MLFNSFEFIGLFLPLAVCAFYFFRRFNYRLALLVLVLFSMFYYAWWSPAYLCLLMASTLANYWLGGLLKNKPSRVLLWLAIAFNLTVLGYFKYYDFAIDNIVRLTGLPLTAPHIILPLGISFFTFQKLAYQVDMFRGQVKRHNLLDFCLFVSFFPQLIAGPIVHHAEMMPQFEHRRNRPFFAGNLAIGFTLFTIGLFKKVIVADNLSIYVSPVYAAAAHGQAVDFYAAWVAALGYTFQLYFDFSGYSDMAVGAARLFGIRLPANFYSPYKAGNIIVFWRRWHMTLSRFLRDYIYFPLGGNRKGEVRRIINLMLTMLLGGLWHGAGWTFVIWGALHGVFLVINHLWRWILDPCDGVLYRLVCWGATFAGVVCGWVIFRAQDMGSAFAVLKGMTGGNGLSLPAQIVSHNLMPAALSAQTSTASIYAAAAIAGASFISFCLPNTYQFMRRYRPMLLPRRTNEMAGWTLPLRWRPNVIWGVLMAALFIAAIGGTFSGRSEFLYFNF